MKVEILSYTPNPEQVVAAAARLCYSADGVADLMEKMDDQKISVFVKKLGDMGHESPFEHVSFTFGIEGVSRALSHQMVRHRIASYSQKSQRYVNEKNFTYIVPPSISSKREALASYQEQMEIIRRAYQKLSDMVPQEDARYILPNACETKLVVTMNVRSLTNFFRLRCCRRAQWEIRRLAEKMLEEVRKIAPLLFAGAGPVCDSEGYCPEGDYSCGRLHKEEKSH